MKNKYLNFLLIAGTILMCSCGSYSKKMTKTLEEALGKDFKNYYAFSYPTNNFGILTTYEYEVSEENYLCGMLDCFDSLEAQSSSEWLDLKGLADIGEGPPITINKKTQFRISINAVLPKLWKTLELQGGIDKKSITNVNLNMGKGYVRQLNRLRFNDLINSLPDDNLYKIKYLSGNLVIVVSDVVVTSMEAIVELEDSMKIALEAKFASGIVNSEFTGIDLNGEVERIASGKYAFKINQPVIILRFAKKQPQAGTLEEPDNFDEWIPVKDYIESKKYVDSILER